MIRQAPPLAAVPFAAILLLAGCSSQEPPAQTPADGIVALTGARLIDGTGRAPIEQATLLVRDGRIEAAGAAADVQIPAGAARVDLSGKTVMPGIVNAHGHVQHLTDTMPVRDDLVRRLQMYTNYGVTTVVSLGQGEDDLADVVTLRDEQDQIDLDRARVYTSGPSTRGHQTPDEARQAVNQLADRGVDRIKFHMQGGDGAMSGETVAGLIDQTHVRGLRAASHIFTLAEAKLVVDGGIDVVAHSVRDQDVDEALITAMKSRNVGYVPTLTRELSVFTYETTPAFFEEPFFQRGMSLYGDEVAMLSDEGYQQKVRANEGAQAIKAALAQASRNLKILSDAGVPIALGTDSGAGGGRWQGYFEHVEMEMMVKAGMTPMQVLVAATGGAAAVSNLDQVGTIAPGKAADFLVLDANPLDDIRNTRQIDSVWIAGRQLTDPN
jgi:imidazolonepropionase-like amidohydrolase